MNELEGNDKDFEEIQKSFLKMKSHMSKDGYREGIESGKQKVYQQYFDQGYVGGFQNGYTLGKLKGTLWAKAVFTNSNRCNIEALEKSTTASCVLCTKENLLSQPITDIAIKQSEVLSSLITNITNNVE